MPNLIDGGGVRPGRPDAAKVAKKKSESSGPATWTSLLAKADPRVVSKPQPSRPQQAAPSFDWRKAMSLTTGQAPATAPAEPETRSTQASFGGRGAFGGRGTLAYPDGQDSEARAREVEQRKAAEVRAEREKILGITTGALSTTPEMLQQLRKDVKPLTEEQYLKLPERQRAAVDFNTLLTDAVRKDLRRQDDYEESTSKQQRGSYDKAVKNMFGEDRGSDIYAPETMAVLRQLNIKDGADDLDDYLGLKVAITADDLKDVTEQQPVMEQALQGTASPGEQTRETLLERVTDRTVELQDRLAQGNKMLQSFKASAGADLKGDLVRLGGLSTHIGTPALGFAPGKFNPETGAPQDLSGYFQNAFDRISSHDGDPKELMSMVAADLHPDELQQFMAYADARTRNSQLYGAPMGPEEKGSYTSPQEFRKLLGLDK